MFRNDWQLSMNSKTFDALDCSLFRNFRFMTVVNYAFFVVFLTGLKIALFVSDVYTCIKLLAFNTWSNNIIQPYISFRISKWLFSGCILASVVLIIWEVANGIRIYRTRNISLTYVNNFSRGVYSLSQYNKFCVYDRIMPEGAFQKVAFYTFFELKDCVRLLVTDTPRQVINGLTLWSVLVSRNHNDLGKLENISGLLAKIKTIAQTNREEAILLSFMLFSFVVWAFFMSKFVIACVCSIYVYYKLLNEWKRGLKEYVCVTVSEHVNLLVEKYREKRNDTSQPFGKTSFRSSEDKYMFSSSTADLLSKPALGRDLEMGHPSPYFSAFEDSKTNLKFSNEAVGDSDTSGELLQRPTDLFRDSGTQVDLHEEPETSTLVSRETTTAEAQRRDPPGDLLGEFEYSNEPLRESGALSEPPRNSDSPVQPLSAIVNLDNPNVRIGAYNTVSKFSKVCTPERAYFGDTGSECVARSSSLMDRRNRIENEDYEYYTKGK
ncbi:LAME_0D04764g1_1 [Lachancea meyersii CBS 8951]|uniref:LAME_0D04764g1_1 n=1 Tax=Lachancea meyersii CBS 8951 TaxID=1266667 RepID=A0A1G4J8B5_9SACH|nr:LAME_0D04764g1_1 [Lachancea meyersii CBS 8951]